MKFLKRFSLMAVVCMFLLTVVSCGGISQKYADKINKAAEAKDYVTYSEVVDKLGEKNIVKGVIGEGSLATGAIIAVKGVTNLEELQAKIEAGKGAKGIVVIILGGNAVSATFGEITADDIAKLKGAK